VKHLKTGDVPFRLNWTACHSVCLRLHLQLAPSPKPCPARAGHAPRRAHGLSLAPPLIRIDSKQVTVGAPAKDAASSCRSRSRCLSPATPPVVHAFAQFRTHAESHGDRWYRRSRPRIATPCNDEAAPRGDTGQPRSTTRENSMAPSNAWVALSGAMLAAVVILGVETGAHILLPGTTCCNVLALN
jgi:hypothetical protein